MPGNGWFVPAMWLAGFVALLIAPSWPGFVAVISDATLTAAVLDLSDGAGTLGPDGSASNAKGRSSRAVRVVVARLEKR